jgi:serine/threonine-protein kinase
MLNWGRTQSTVWVDRKGKEEPISAPPNAYNHPRISPDGTRIALSLVTDGNADVWIWDLVRKTLTRLTFNKEPDAFPLWTADGRRIAFHNAQRGVFWKAADGTGQDELIGSVPDRDLYPSSWSGDGKALVFSEGAGANDDIGILSMESDHKYRPLLREKHEERNPQISPNGRWMAYTSDESGRSEIYVRAFPEVDKGGRWQVSSSGGEHPLWSRNGRELFYRNGDTVMGVSVKTDPAFSLETPQVLFKGTYRFVQDEDFSWDISPDGRRFLMIKELTDNAQTPAGASPRRINIVLNWFEELKQRVPLK